MAASSERPTIQRRDLFCIKLLLNQLRVGALSGRRVELAFLGALGLERYDGAAFTNDSAAPVASTTSDVAASLNVTKGFSGDAPPESVCAVLPLSPEHPIGCSKCKRDAESGGSPVCGRWCRKCFAWLGLCGGSWAGQSQTLMCRPASVAWTQQGLMRPRLLAPARETAAEWVSALTWDQVSMVGGCGGNQRRH